jgi:hypothetical protein
MMIKHSWFLAASVLAMVSASASPSVAQEGVFMRQFLGQIGLLPEDKDPIDYKERPALVVPKDTTKLRPPEAAGTHTKSAQWPVDPDVVERKRAEERRNALMVFPTKRDATEGAKLSPTEMAAGRSRKGEVVGERRITTNNDKAGLLLGPEDMKAKSDEAQRQALAPGVEPPREYLTDPPKGLRLPDVSTPIKRTQEAPNLDDKAFRRPNDL